MYALSHTRRDGPHIQRNICACIAHAAMAVTMIMIYGAMDYWMALVDFRHLRLICLFQKHGEEDLQAHDTWILRKSTTFFVRVFRGIVMMEEESGDGSWEVR